MKSQFFIAFAEAFHSFYLSLRYKLLQSTVFTHMNAKSHHNTENDEHNMGD